MVLNYTIDLYCLDFPFHLGSYIPLHNCRNSRPFGHWRDGGIGGDIDSVLHQGD